MAFLLPKIQFQMSRHFLTLKRYLKIPTNELQMLNLGTSLLDDDFRLKGEKFEIVFLLQKSGNQLQGKRFEFRVIL